MSSIASAGLDRFVASFEIRDDSVHVLFDQRKIAVQGHSAISIYEPVRKYAFEVEWFPKDDRGYYGVDFYVKEFDNKVSKYAADLGANVSYMKDSKQLWIFAVDVESIIRVVMHPLFPKDAKPNFDPLEDQNDRIQ